VTEHLIGLIDRRPAELHAGAWTVGERIYVETLGAFGIGISAYWDIWWSERPWWNTADLLNIVRIGLLQRGSCDSLLQTQRPISPKRGRGYSGEPSRVAASCISSLAAAVCELQVPLGVGNKLTV